MFQKVLEDSRVSRIFYNVSECYGMFQNVLECSLTFLNILKCSETRYRMLQYVFQEVVECSKNVLEPEIVDAMSRTFANP